MLKKIGLGICGIIAIVAVYLVVPPPHQASAQFLDQLTFGGTKKYYVNAYHTDGYVRSHWPRNMTVVDIVQFLGTHHDTVVLRRT